MTEIGNFVADKKSATHSSKPNDSTNTKLTWSECKRTGSSFHAIFQKEKYRRYFV